MSVKKISVTHSVKPFAFSGLFFKVMQASGEIQCEFQLANGETYETGLSAGQGVKFDQKYKSIRIAADITQQATVWSGIGELTQDSKNETTISGSASIASSAVALEAGVARQAVDSMLGRRSILLTGTSPFYVGGVDLNAANGLPVDGEITLETQGAIWVVSDTAQELRILEEFN